MAASLMGMWSPFLVSRNVPRFSPPCSLPRFPQFKSNCWDWRVKCVPPGPTGDVAETETENETTSSASSDAFSSLGYKWYAGIGGIGLLETAYLTYLKLTNSDAFCPVGGGTCGDVLNSDYALVFGVPLPLIGMVAYGLVTALGLQLPAKKLSFGISESSGRLVLLGTTTSMAAASGYFLYILSTKFPGTLCLYCLTSAFFSFTLFFLTLKDFGFQETQKLLGIQLCVSILVIGALGASYGFPQPASSRFAEVDLQYFTTEITTPSSPFTLSLAKHLHSIGAKMYGAFWCSHCLEQKQMFGKEASKVLDYVECFPYGYKTGTKMAKVCADARIEGFPTWVIKDRVLNGEQELSELAGVSGFEFNELAQPS